MKVRKAVVFDLDGTLCNIDHRLPLITSEEKDWNKFNKLVIHDTPIENTCEIYRSLYETGMYNIIIASARCDSTRADTENWLNRYNLKYDKLLLRPIGDRRNDCTIKREWLYNDIDLSNSDILCVFEDRPSVVEMYRKEGVTCYQVANWIIGDNQNGNT